MPNPQSPAVRRSEQVPSLNPDATETARSADRPEAPTPSPGPVPEEQQPGHHPDHEQDKPDPEAFAERLGVRPATEDDGGRNTPWWPLALGASAAGAAVGVVRALCARRRRES